MAKQKLAAKERHDRLAKKDMSGIGARVRVSCMILYNVSGTMYALVQCLEVNTNTDLRNCPISSESHKTRTVLSILPWPRPSIDTLKNRINTLKQFYKDADKKSLLLDWSIL